MYISGYNNTLTEVCICLANQGHLLLSFSVPLHHTQLNLLVYTHIYLHTLIYTTCIHANSSHNDYCLYTIIHYLYTCLYTLIYTTCIQSNSSHNDRVRIMFVHKTYCASWNLRLTGQFTVPGNGSKSTKKDGKHVYAPFLFCACTCIQNVAHTWNKAATCSAPIES
jgi:hypothetical protein